MDNRWSTWVFPLSIKAIWLVLCRLEIHKGFPPSPWGHPTRKLKWVKGAPLILGETSYPSIKILMEIHSTTLYRKATATTCNPCTPWGTKWWEEHRAPQVIRHHHGLSQGHLAIFLFGQHWIFPTYTNWQTTPSMTTYNGHRSRIKYQRTFQS